MRCGVAVQVFAAPRALVWTISERVLEEFWKFLGSLESFGRFEEFGDESFESFGRFDSFGEFWMF